MVQLISSCVLLAGQFDCMSVASFVWPFNSDLGLAAQTDKLKFADFKVTPIGFVCPPFNGYPVGQKQLLQSVAN